MTLIWISLSNLTSSDLKMTSFHTGDCVHCNADFARLIDEMRKLVERFPNGYEAPCRPDTNLEETPRESTFSKTHLSKVPECVM